KSRNIHIYGELHTVQPISARYNTLVRNDREYTIMKTENFGRVVQVEVGALMVGKITNLHGACRVFRGQEKGRFEFGGSTIVLLLQKDSVELNGNILENTRRGLETPVKMGEYIAVAKHEYIK
ncbi:MAG: phosphatidylserine decarboxylase, partial [Oscillospiraceae bacterium]